MVKVELLAPAGNMEKLKMALIYGADAVFLGGKSFGLRAFSGNFSNEEIKEAVNFAHDLHKKVYVTVNIFPHNDDLNRLDEYLLFLYHSGVDAIIMSDLGVYRVARKVVPDLPLHISTQANNTNYAAVQMWEDLGAKRVVLARELSMNEIGQIRQKTAIELESFVQGAMCISYSGRCLLSNYFTGRDANRGECAQACRWKYHLVEQTRPGEYFPVLEDEKGTYIFNSKDLCMLPYLPQLIKCGLNSFKIEGRMKSVHYVATVVRVYRQAIDSYYNDPAHFTVRQEWLDELEKISHRPYTSGFYLNKPTGQDQIYSTSSYIQSHDFVGLVKDYNAETGMAVIEQRNNIKVGDCIEIVQPKLPTFSQTIAGMYDENNEYIEVAPHPQQVFTMPVKQHVEPFAMVRRGIAGE